MEGRAGSATSLLEPGDDLGLESGLSEVTHWTEPKTLLSHRTCIPSNCLAVGIDSGNQLGPHRRAMSVLEEVDSHGPCPYQILGLYMEQGGSEPRRYCPGVRVKSRQLNF